MIYLRYYKKKKKSRQCLGIKLNRSCFFFLILGGQEAEEGTVLSWENWSVVTNKERIKASDRHWVFSDTWTSLCAGWVLWNHVTLTSLAPVLYKWAAHNATTQSNSVLLHWMNCEQDVFIYILSFIFNIGQNFPRVIFFSKLAPSREKNIFCIIDAAETRLLWRPSGGNSPAFLLSVSRLRPSPTLRPLHKSTDTMTTSLPSSWPPVFNTLTYIAQPPGCFGVRCSKTKTFSSCLLESHATPRGSHK